MMALEIFRISEAPYNRTTWAGLAAAAAHVGMKTAELRAVADTIGAKCFVVRGELVRKGGNAHDRKAIEVVDFGKLGASAAWRELEMADRNRRSQGRLF